MVFAGWQVMSRSSEETALSTKLALSSLKGNMFIWKGLLADSIHRTQRTCSAQESKRRFKRKTLRENTHMFREACPVYPDDESFGLSDRYNKHVQIFWHQHKASGIWVKNSSFAPTKFCKKMFECGWLAAPHSQGDGADRCFKDFGRIWKHIKHVTTFFENINQIPSITAHFA